ncbi:MAG: MFS transporter [Myxococcota bacterium]
MTDDAPASTRSSFLVLLPLWLMVLAASSQVMVVAPVLPRIEAELGIPEARLGFIVSGYATALSAFALVAGPVSDRVGRRRIILVGTGIMTAALGLHAFAGDFWSLLAIRMTAGAAGGVLTGSAVSYVGDYFPYEKRGWASGWVMSGFAVGQILGVPAGAMLADRYGFKAPFLLFCVVMAFAFVMAVVFMPQPDVARSTSVGIGSSLARYRGLLRRRPVAFAALAYATMFFAVSNFVVYFPKWAEETRGLSADQIASLFMVGGVASVVFGPRAGKVSDRFGRKPLIVASCWGTTILFAVTPWLVVGPITAYVMFFIAMVLLAMRLSPFQALLTALSSSDERGTLMSLVVAVGQLGGGIGAAVAGTVYSDYGYVGCTSLAALSITFTGVFVLRGLPEPPRNEAQG